jgi:riboflavin biosynthesis pyrimidine reductase
VLTQLGTGEPVDDVLGLVMAEGRHGPGRPWVLLNMVSSIDGATAVDGGSTALSDDDDRALFHVLRAVPDVILVGAGTVRAENYRPVSLPEASVERRRRAGMTPVPRLAVVSGRLDLDPGARVFSDPSQPPLVITGPSADWERMEQLAGLADVVTLPGLGAEEVIGALGGAKVILCEGGPSLNAQLMAAGLVDEVNWTISPLLVSGGSKRIASGDPVDPPTEMRLARALAGDRSVFLRFVRA